MLVINIYESYKLTLKQLFNIVVGHPKEFIHPGACELLQDLICHILKTLNLYNLKPQSKIRSGVGYPKATIIHRKLKRVLLNTEEVKTLLENNGYFVEVKSFDDITIAEQIRIVRTSALLVGKNAMDDIPNYNLCIILIGIHGAGLANLIWLNVNFNPAVIEIFPFNFTKYTYQTLALSLRVNYVGVKTTKESNSKETEFSNDYKEADKRNYYRNLDTKVDLEDLQLALNALPKEHKMYLNQPIS
ncbi:hypothetical protein Zmor_016444 [Zophobas morio]|jgi:hypothetical protein|uniref:Glycosyltransferase 61 catalytic domain-containing protein n=1 Tax=Zophobas morio TaxID=2755281 RepID=A0AA38M0X6_9CUCU|nr:hypothetical protein Zmor_016444 [Zophobas morio]